MKEFTHFVEQRYYDNGKTEARILTPEEAQALNYYDGLNLEEATYDLWVEGCHSEQEARKMVRDTLNA